MTFNDFKSWRKAMGLKRKQAARLLGIKKSAIRAMEKTKTGKKTQQVPKAIALACYALSRGVSEFDGKTAKNSFSGLGASEDIVMEKPQKSSSKKSAR